MGELVLEPKTNTLPLFPLVTGLNPLGVPLYSSLWVSCVLSLWIVHLLIC